MTALAVTDIGSLIVHMPYGLARPFDIRCDRRIPFCATQSFNYLRLQLSYYMTYVSFELGNMFEAISAWITLLICIERLITMRWPHVGKMNFSRRQGKWQLTLTITLAILFHIPLFFVLEIKQKEITTNLNETRRYHVTVLTPFGNSMYYYAYTWIRFLLVQCIPLILLCIVNVLLLIVIWSSYSNQKTYELKRNREETNRSKALLSVMKEHRIEIDRQSAMETQVIDDSQVGSIEKFRSSEPSQSDVQKASGRWQSNNKKRTKSLRPTRKNMTRLDRVQQANHKLTILLVVVSFSFLFGQIPQAIAYAHIIKLFIPNNCPECYMYASLYQHLSHLLCLITSTTNFLLYVTLNKHFRDRLNELCCHV
ncbi:hypothetical protein PHET_04686 [Paragonimus heterotremus]|uniref:G-protein coupled receptors family 1 profile domain-containing protein n=1 Tax=Paragonimus heterotremus TaxID=100268 RepID=A0A8J4T1I5_9TREM|nr:hypothetical protein PHET_04686 [Paragonimus heterotremus]